MATSTAGSIAKTIPCGWHVTEYEEALELQPGMTMIAQELVHIAKRLGAGDPCHGIAAEEAGWQSVLAGRSAKCRGRENTSGYVILRRWPSRRRKTTRAASAGRFLAAASAGPGKAFWKSFYTAPRREVPRQWSEGFVRRLLAAAYGEKPAALADLRKAGFRVYTNPAAALLPSWKEEPLPKWTEPYRWEKGTLRGVRYLLTFCPWKFLPAARPQGVSGGRVALAAVSRQSRLLRCAALLEAPGRAAAGDASAACLHSLFRHEAPHSIRIPQSGWLHEKLPGNGHEPHLHGPVRDTFRRSHRWQRIHRHEDDWPWQAPRTS